MTDEPAVPHPGTPEGAPAPPPSATGGPAAPPPAAGDPGAPPPTAGGPFAGGPDVPPPGPPPGGAGFTSRYGLVRPREGRYLAGVCAAIGRATNTDPVLWRVLLAVLGFFGGIGILVYLAAWLAIPAEGDTASPVEAMLGRGRSSMSPVTVLVLGVLVAVLFGLIVTDKFRAVLLGAAILIVGALLLNRNGDRAGTASGPPGADGSGWPPSTATTGPEVRPGHPADPVTGTGVGMAGTPEVGYPAQPGPALGAEPPYPVEPYSAGRLTEPYSAAPPPGVSYPPAYSAGPPAAYPTGASAPPAPASGAPAGYGTPSWPVSAPPPVADFPAATPLGPTLDRGYRPAFAPHGPYATTPVRDAAAPGPPKPPKPPRERSPLGAATFSLIFVAIGVVAVLDLTNAVPVAPSTYFFAALGIIALGLLVGAWFGRARWLIALGLAASLALGISTLAEVGGEYDNMGSSATWVPVNTDELADSYTNTFGDATLDLRGLDFTGQDRQVTVTVHFGTLRVRLPATVDATVSTDVNAGDAQVFRHHWSGVDAGTREVTDLGPDGAGGGKLRLELRVDAGNVEVSR